MGQKTVNNTNPIIKGGIKDDRKENDAIFSGLMEVFPLVIKTGNLNCAIVMVYFVSRNF
ncbi:hypothetical protein BROSI_A1710 [Candidatus Brocadia sinica JPN1]|uniref:Uncharacterized protein n=1 Tax=Candidatus Brocadia sinica JPN1 TaxID=1197129 RepID=A0ABQ0JWY9_9BACT|nr:hypothetical protein BROSI_A1710 [Candidatus Brocadia sinica JPN1]GIK13037.1 MAG: hypothetical protein BroJett002_17440 [Candidatus Brocadia sinica]GJQ16714.1 MAG: hypothetical protein HBSIN01_06730 [Candidatus Brocadia sinica]